MGGFVEFRKAATFWSLRSAGYQCGKSIPDIMCFIWHFYPQASFFFMFKWTGFTKPWSRFDAVPDCVTMFVWTYLTWHKAQMMNYRFYLFFCILFSFCFLLGLKFNVNTGMQTVIIHENQGIIMPWCNKRYLSYVKNDFFYLSSCLLTMVVFKQRYFLFQLFISDT